MVVLGVLMPTESKTRCGFCGMQSREGEDGESTARIVTTAIDWRVELICDDCVESHDWTDWVFDPVLNTYTRG